MLMPLTKEEEHLVRGVAPASADDLKHLSVAVGRGEGMVSSAAVPMGALQDSSHGGSVHARGQQGRLQAG